MRILMREFNRCTEFNVATLLEDNKVIRLTRIDENDKVSHTYLNFSAYRYYTQAEVQDIFMLLCSTGFLDVTIIDCHGKTYNVQKVHNYQESDNDG